MTTSYTIKYSTNKNLQYIYLDEKTTLDTFNNLHNYIPDKKIISKIEFTNRLKKFNFFIKEISKFIYYNDEKASIKFIKELMAITEDESKILYKIFKLINSNIKEIKESNFIKKQHGGFLGSICTPAILITDIAGMLPGIGIPIDTFGVILSLVCGDYFGAGLGLVSIIPVVGMATGGVEVIRGVLKLTGFLSDDKGKVNENKDDKGNENKDDSSPFDFISGMLGNEKSDTKENENKDDSSPFDFISGMLGNKKSDTKDKNTKDIIMEKSNDRKFNSYEYEYQDKKHYEYEYYDDDIYKYEYYEN